MKLRRVSIENETDTHDFNKGNAFGSVAYASLAVFILREFEKCNNKAYSEQRNELSNVWNQLMRKIASKGVEHTFPFPG